MNKIAVIGDVHLQGQNLHKIKTALNQVCDKIASEGCDYCVFTGDIFHRGNIADRYASVGTLQSVFMETIQRINAVVLHTWVVLGNHDEVGVLQGHALEFLRNHACVTVVDKPVFDEHFTFQYGFSLGFLPWINKSNFYAKQCLGLSKDEAQARFNEATSKMLGIFNFRDDVPGFLFGHCEIAGARHGGYTLVGGCYEFTEDQLLLTGADVVRLGHIHKRQGLYTGALCQTNFGEEGNPQGFDIIEFTSKEDINVRFVPIESESFFTIALQTNEQATEFFRKMDQKNHYKIRFITEESYIPEFGAVPGVQIEKLWGRKEFVSRTKCELSATMTDSELLEHYMALNPLPVDVSGDDLRSAMEVVL